MDELPLPLSSLPGLSLGTLGWLFDLCEILTVGGERQREVDAGVSHLAKMEDTSDSDKDLEHVEPPNMLSTSSDITRVCPELSLACYLVVLLSIQCQ